MLDGRVQGVVVQMAAKVLAGSAMGKTSRSLGSVSGKRTNTECEVWSAYSTSASARAVRQEQHQCTGFLPR